MSESVTAEPGGLPPGMVAIPLGKGCTLIIPQRIYVAGLKLGKYLRRREAMLKRGTPPPISSAPPQKPLEE